MEFDRQGAGRRFLLMLGVVVIGATVLTLNAAAQQASGDLPSRFEIVSPELMSGGRITFRVLAPACKSVQLKGVFGGPYRRPMTRGNNGVWDITIGPLEAGAYSYVFELDGVTMVDPHNPATTEGDFNAWSLVYVPGSDLWDTKDVPHGTVGSVTYKSSSLGFFRRMHVYTPPGYEGGTGRYPVLYLLHGSGDSDDTWTRVGRANFVLDNLIAGNKARAMIVVMPEIDTSSRLVHEEFFGDFTKDIVPYIESHYRVLKGPKNTAIAGASRGGCYALDIAFARLDRFGYVGLFSAGLFATPASEPETQVAPPWRGQGPAIRHSPFVADWERSNAAALDNAALKKNVRLLWFATGAEDGFRQPAQAAVELLEKHGFAPVHRETDGGHSWINWRHYLAEFAPQLFWEK